MRHLRILCLFAGILLAGCQKSDPKPIVVGGPSDGPAPSIPGTVPTISIANVSPEERYDALLSQAFQQMADKQDDAALASLKEAQAIRPSDFVKSEIDRIEASQNRQALSEQTALNIRSLISTGKPEEAAQLAATAAVEFPDAYAAQQFLTLKVQADAFVAPDLTEQARKQRFLDQAEAARQAGNLRVALTAYDQASAVGADLAPVKDVFEDIRSRLTRYDESRAMALDMRRDPYRLEDAVRAYETARAAWDTAEVRQEIQDSQLALHNRKDRVAIADFEAIGDVGIPAVGRMVAEEMLGHFRPRFDVMERSQLNSLVGELKLDPARLLTDDRGREELGRLSRARYLVVGSVSRLYGIDVNARLVDTQTGLIVQTAKISAGTPQELSEKLPTLARILQMSDDQKRQYERELAAAATIAPAVVQPLPAPPIEPSAAPVPLIVTTTACRPDYGVVVLADFNGIPQPAPTPVPVAIIEVAPWRERAICVAIELGDYAFRTGHVRQAYRQYEYALSLAPGRPDIRLRLDRCRPYLPIGAPVVVVSRPRLVVMPFVEFGTPGFFPPGAGAWTADELAPYFSAGYDIVDRGEVYWWMGKLGMSVRDVILDPQARLCLGRALNARFFLVGSLEPTFSFNARASVVDAEFNNRVGDGMVHVQNMGELKYRLGELARATTLPPAQVPVFAQQAVVAEQRVREARLQIGKGKFQISIGIVKQVLVDHPHDIAARELLREAEWRQQQAFLEGQRQQVLAQQAALEADRQRQIALALEADRQRRQAEAQAAVAAEVQRQQWAERQRRAEGVLIIQAQNAQKNRNLSLSVGLFESAAGLGRSPALVQDVAQARALQAEQQRTRLLQAEATARAEAERRQQAELARAREQLAAEQLKRAAAEQARLTQEAAARERDYQRLLDEAQASSARGNHELAVSALQSARRLKPSTEIDRLVTAALTEQARAEAVKKGEDERKRLEQQLALEAQRRQAAELEAAKNQTVSREAIARARNAMKERKFDVAAAEFRQASLKVRSDEALQGIREAEEAAAQAKALAAAEDAARAKQAQQQQEFQQTVAIAQAAAAKQDLDGAITAYQKALTMKPSDVAVQAERAKLEQLRDERRLTTQRKKNEERLAALAAERTAKEAASKADAEKLAAAKLAEQDRIAKLDADKLAIEKANADRLVREAAAKAEAERLAKLELEKKAEADRIAKLATEKKAEADRIAKLDGEQKAAALKLETERLAKIEADRIAKLTADKLAAAKAEQERLAKLEADKKAEADRIAKLTNDQRLAALKLEAEKKAEAERLAKLEADKLNAAKLAAAKLEAERLAKLEADKKAEADRIAKLNGDKLAAAKAEQERLAKLEADKKAEADRIAKLANDQRLAALKLEAEKKAEAERLAKIEADRLAALKLETEKKAAAAKLEAERLAKLEADRLAALKLETEKKAIAAKLEAERLAKIEADKKATAAKLEADRLAAIKLEAEKKAAAERMVAIKKQYDATMMAAKAALAAKNYPAAAQGFSEALKLMPNDPEATKGLADAQRLAAQPKVEQPKVDRVQEALTIAAGHEAKLDYASAQNVLKPAVGAAPMNAELKKRYEFVAAMASGQRDLAAGKFGEAILSFDAATRMMPNDPTAKKLLEQAKLRKK